MIKGGEKYSSNLGPKNYIMDEHDNLTIGGRIWDEEAYGSDERVFNTWRSFGPDETLPATLNLDDDTSYGHFVLSLSIEELEDH
jgi:hypothetical protein